MKGEVLTCVGMSTVYKELSETLCGLHKIADDEECRVKLRGVLSTSTFFFLCVTVKFLKSEPSFPR